jgi:hypothetical protein
MLDHNSCRFFNAKLTMVTLITALIYPNLVLLEFMQCISISASKTTPALKTSANSFTEQVRLHSLDTTRGIAVMAILSMNIWGFGLPFEAYANPNAYGGIDGWDLTS